MGDVKEKKNKAYAGQVVDVPRSRKRISFTDRLKRVSEEEGEPYLNVFAESSIYLLSLFVFGESHSLTANLPIKDIPFINRRTALAGAEIFRAKNSSQALPVIAEDEPSKTDTPVPAAFTELKVGTFAGKAPGDLLLEADDAERVKETLLQQVNFLQRKLKDFPQNQLQINAINDAINSYEMGILEDMKPNNPTATKEGASGIRPAFTKLKMGTFAGKTPGNLLLEANDVKKVKDSLLQQASFLQSKLKDFPQNQLQIDAINDAIQAYDDGVLASQKPTEAEAVEENAGVTYEIYKTPIKHQKRVKSDGKHECYSVYVSCSPAKQYPYKIEIMNCNAPLIKMKNGLMPPDMSKADSIRKENIELKEEEWEYILDWINSNIALTRNLWYPELRMKDEANRWKGDQN